VEVEDEVTAPVVVVTRPAWLDAALAELEGPLEGTRSQTNRARARAVAAAADARWLVGARRIHKLKAWNGVMSNSL
jgi:hypothetical protein